MRNITPKRRLPVWIGAILCFGALAACEVTTQPLTSDEIAAVAADRTARIVSADQEPVDGPVSLYEAMARAIKYNLDFRIESANVRLRTAEQQLTTMDLLPNLVVDADRTLRNNNPGGSSVNLRTGLRSTDASRSNSRDTLDSSLTLSWDVLDFGLSYYRAKQAANDVQIAREQRRAVVNRLVEDVRVAYWRTVSAQRLLPRVDELLEKAERALAQSKRLTNGGFSDPTTGLIYQRDLLRVLGEVQSLKRDLSTAKFQLTALMNQRAGDDFMVFEGPRFEPPTITDEASALVSLAMVNRPELREVTYQQRNEALEKDAAFLELLPSLRPYLSLSWSSNDLVANQQWSGAGVRASWDLMNLIRSGPRNASIEAREEYLDARALALTQAISTQVYVAKARFEALRFETKTAEDFRSVSDRISRAIQARSASGLIGLQEEVFEEMGAILAELRYDARYSEMQAAYANVYAAIGLNNYPHQLTGDEPVEVLSEAIRQLWIARGENG